MDRPDGTRACSGGGKFTGQFEGVPGGGGGHGERDPQGDQFTAGGGGGLIEKYKLEIDDDLDDIRTAVGDYQKKLMDAVAGIENEIAESLPMTQGFNR